MFSFSILCFQTSCTLTLFNMTDENIIISARLPHDSSKINPMELLRKEKVNFSSYLIWFMCCYFMCVFPFTIFFLFCQNQECCVLLRRRIKKREIFYRFIFRLLLYFLFDIWIYSWNVVFFRCFYSDSYDGWFIWLRHLDGIIYDEHEKI